MNNSCYNLHFLNFETKFFKIKLISLFAFKKISDFILSGREIDITNESELYSKLDVIQPEIIVLAAAETNSVKIDENPISALETNIKGAVNVTKYCVERKDRILRDLN